MATDEMLRKKAAAAAEASAVEETANGAATTDASTPADGATVETDALRGELEQVRKELSETQDRYLRTVAEVDNVRKRMRTEADVRVWDELRAAVAGLLPVLDNFQRALQAMEQTDNRDALVEGVRLTQKQLQDALAKIGVEPISAQGQPFNPDLHEAIMQTPASDEHPANTVVEEIQPGYTLRGKVLRPALVRVAQ
jgi:molecular chaperone GrpE